jgi:hypothetical protein
MYILSCVYILFKIDMSLTNNLHPPKRQQCPPGGGALRSFGTSELAAFGSYTTLRRERKEHLYWHSMAVPTAVKAKPGLLNIM